MKVLAINGSYRKGHACTQLLEEVLSGAREAGAKTELVELIDREIKYCENCRACCQDDKPEPGHCKINDDMAGLIAKCREADALVIASPINMWTATGLIKVFAERLLPLGFWRWDMWSPKMRPEIPPHRRRAVLISTSAAPGWMAALTGSTSFGVTKSIAAMFNAKIVGRMTVGLLSMTPRPVIREKHLRRAHQLGRRLAV